MSMFLADTDRHVTKDYFCCGFMEEANSRAPSILYQATLAVRHLKGTYPLQLWRDCIK